MTRIIGIDPGNKKSGMIVMDDCNIVEAVILGNELDLYSKIANFSLHSKLVVVIEDIKPYSLRLTPEVIDTCKFIGELEYRLKMAAGINVQLVSRYDVKKWTFDTFPQVCLPIIEKKIEAKLFDACRVSTKELVRIDNKGKEKRKASFIYIDDKCVTEAMKHLHGIPQPSPGKGFRHGLQSHSFQALAVASFFKYRHSLESAIIAL